MPIPSRETRRPIRRLAWALLLGGGITFAFGAGDAEEDNYFDPLPTSSAAATAFASPTASVRGRVMASVQIPSDWRTIAASRSGIGIWLPSGLSFPGSVALPRSLTAWLRARTARGSSSAHATSARSRERTARAREAAIVVTPTPAREPYTATTNPVGAPRRTGRSGCEAPCGGVARRDDLAGGRSGMRHRDRSQTGYRVPRTL